MDLSGAATVAVNAVAGLLTPIAGAAPRAPFPGHLRRGGREVLRRAGHDPVTLTRQVFADQQDPSWGTRLHAREPAPIAEAPSRGSGPLPGTAASVRAVGRRGSFSEG